MNHPAAPRHVAGWLNDLAALTAGNSPLTEAKTKVAALTGVLVNDYPAEAFCRQSLTHVARECKFFPSYAELCEHLGAWWLEHRPTHIAIAAPTQDAWSQQVASERATAAADWADPAKVTASVRSLIDHPMRHVLGPMLGALVKRHAPANLSLIPPEWTVPSTDPRAATERQAVKPAHFTPEQLAAVKAGQTTMPPKEHAA